MYCKCGSLSHARKLFDEMPERDIVFLGTREYVSGLYTFSELWKGGSHGEVLGGVCVLGRSDVRLEGLDGNELRGVVIGNAGYDLEFGDCDEAFSLFRKMSEAGLVPDVATWNAMICGFVQSGEMVKGVELFRDMLVVGVKPNPVTVTGLLPAFGSSGIAQSVNCYGKKPGGFVTLSNVYAGEGEWAKVEMLREVMKLQGVQKLPGFSSLSSDI
ncbi:pentatricopeptide repeat-containing protein [Tanacetum coccineum]